MEREQFSKDAEAWAVAQLASISALDVLLDDMKDHGSISYKAHRELVTALSTIMHNDITMMSTLIDHKLIEKDVHQIGKSALDVWAKAIEGKNTMYSISSVTRPADASHRPRLHKIRRHTKKGGR